VRSRGYWQNLDNRKRFFKEYAAERGFNPTLIDNWRTVTVDDIVARKGMGPLIWYNGSLELALKSTFAA